MLGNIEGPFTDDGYEFAMKPIGVFVCDMVYNIIPTTFFNKGPSLSLKCVYYVSQSCAQGQLDAQV